jgi:hypothetical protein
MHSRTRISIAVFFTVFMAISASAAPEGKSESRDWIDHHITRIVQQLKKIFAPLPFGDPDPIPPKP